MQNPYQQPPLSSSGQSTQTYPVQREHVQPPQPFYQHPLVPRKARRWPWIVALIVVFIIGIGVGTISVEDTTKASTQPTTNQQSSERSAAIDKPGSLSKWTTTHTFSGNGTKKTETFTVGDRWKLHWKCNPASDITGEYNVMVDVKNSDNTSLDLAAVNTICKSGNTGDETEEHQGGDVYLDVNSEGAWTLTIQELK